MEHAMLPAGFIPVQGQTFGVEVEFSGADRDAVAEELHRLGLGAQPHSVGHREYSKRARGKWVVEYDWSTGGEAVSPVLTDTKSAWTQLQTVCDVIKKHGGYVDKDAGAHVHVGVKSSGIDNAFTGAKKLIRLCRWSEDLLYRLGSGTTLKGQSAHRGMLTGWQHCKPMLRDVCVQCLNTSNPREIVSRMGRHNEGINFEYMQSGKRTVEFRYADGTLDPARWQTNVYLACALMSAAARLSESDVPKAAHPVGTHDRDGASGERLFREFCELVVGDQDQRHRLRTLYDRTLWVGSNHIPDRQRGDMIDDAFTAETRRIIAHYKQTGGALTNHEQTWLREFVDGRCQVSPAPSPQCADAAQWWTSQQPLSTNSAIKRHMSNRDDRLQKIGAPPASPADAPAEEPAPERRFRLPFLHRGQTIA